MTEFWQLFNSNPGAALIVMVFVIVALLVIVAGIKSALRTITIWFRGYPPPHCDADGNEKDSIGD